MQAGSQLMAGRSQKAAYQFEAQQMREQARMAKLEMQNEILKRSEEADRIRRANIARAGANGINPMASRSFTNLQATDDRLLQRDINLLKVSGQSRVSQMEGQANQYMAAGRSAFRTSLISAAGTLGSGAYDFYRYSPLNAGSPTVGTSSYPVSPAVKTGGAL